MYWNNRFRWPFAGAKEGSHLGSDLEDEDLSEQETRIILELSSESSNLR